MNICCRLLAITTTLLPCITVAAAGELRIVHQEAPTTLDAGSVITIPIIVAILGNPDTGVIVSSYVGALLMGGAYQLLCHAPSSSRMSRNIDRTRSITDKAAPKPKKRSNQLN